MVTSTDQLIVVGYSRVSTEKQVGDGHSSLETQPLRHKQWTAERGGRLVKEIADIQSGWRDDRPEYQRMLDYVRNNPVDVVLVQYLDRFGRKPQEILTRIWELKDLGISVEATDQDIKDEMILLLTAGMAGHESKRVLSELRARADLRPN